MDTYTILDMSNEFRRYKEVIRRLIKKLDLKALNEYTREHNNEALIYDIEVYETIANEYSHKTKHAHSSGTDNSAQSAMIKLLQEQLNQANKDKDQLMYLLQQSQSLSSTLQDKIRLIENKTTDEVLKKDNETKEVKQGLFSRIFKR